MSGGGEPQPSGAMWLPQEDVGSMKRREQFKYFAVWVVSFGVGSGILMGIGYLSYGLVTASIGIDLTSIQSPEIVWYPLTGTLTILYLAAEIALSYIVFSLGAKLGKVQIEMIQQWGGNR